MGINKGAMGGQQEPTMLFLLGAMLQVLLTGTMCIELADVPSPLSDDNLEATIGGDDGMFEYRQDGTMVLGKSEGSDQDNAALKEDAEVDIHAATMDHDGIPNHYTGLEAGDP